MITIEIISGKSVAEQPFEIVERKGKGHPDTLCDSIMEAISVALSAAYIEQFGTILHHNIDKGLLAAGKAEIWFGGGRIVQPMELTIGDRATFSAAGRSIAVEDVAIGAAKEWIRRNMPHIDPERHMVMRPVLAPGSSELSNIFSGGGIMVANDTSAAVGYYPLSPTEQAVLALEEMLNSQSFKGRFPETGEDVKVMALRNGRQLDMTVAMPLLASLVGSEQEYFSRKEAVRREMLAFLEGMSGFDEVGVGYNALDQEEAGLQGVYLSLLGTSAENADSGQVGRGNRVNGLIAVNRPLGTEAAAGKNPVSHVGKIYNVLSHLLARLIYEEVKGLKEVHVFLLSRIGSPVNQPLLAAVQLLPEHGPVSGKVERQVKEICARELGRLDLFCTELARGVHRIC